jgi:hypothetical protein
MLGVHHVTKITTLIFLTLRVALVTPASAEITPQDAEFFEAKIRPLLVARCYACHSGNKAKGGLTLDTRNGWQKGGNSGAVIMPGKPDESLLIKAVR